ncbi:hypothetical protein GF412_02805 [Candidatus Micrarchaeota archaeon]|nr:hypothetical protein [Candidatus Micrarchaeota archaeon]MBD3417888.1 hypothetical protein [Candidatus Micrarchaeota archaeon]
MVEKFLKPKKGKTKMAKPVLSEKERKASAEQRLLGYLDKFHRGQVLPPKYKKALLKESVEIDEEAKKNTEERVAHAEKKGVLPSRAEKVKIWQNEYLKSMVMRLNSLLKTAAERRVDKIIASLEGKHKEHAEKNREKYVVFMQNYLARNPNFLFEGEAKESAAKVVERVLASLEGKDREDFLKIKDRLARHVEKYFLENPARIREERQAGPVSKKTAELEKLKKQVKQLEERIAQLEKGRKKR